VLSSHITFIKITVCMMLSALLVGCVGISRPSTQVLDIKSNPPGALAELSVGRQCVTPCSLVVPRKDDIDIKFSLAGYQDLAAVAESKLDQAGLAHIAGNVATGYLTLGVASAVALLAGIASVFDPGASVGPGVWIVAGAVCVYLIYATARDAGKGKARALQPNPIEVELQPISQPNAPAAAARNR